MNLCCGLAAAHAHIQRVEGWRSYVMLWQKDRRLWTVQQEVMCVSKAQLYRIKSLHTALA